IPELGDPSRIDRQRRRARQRMIQRDPAIDLPAADLARQQIAQSRIQRAQLVRKLELDVQITVIDRAQFDAERAAGQLGGSRRETGHARDHGFRAAIPEDGAKRKKLNEIFTLYAVLPENVEVINRTRKYRRNETCSV